MLDKWPSTAVLLSDDVELMQKSFTNWDSQDTPLGMPIPVFESSD